MIDQLDGMRSSKGFNEPYATSLHSRRSVEAYLDQNMAGWRDRLSRLQDESTTISVPAAASKIPKALADFIGSENMGPNFNAMTLGVNARMNSDGRRSLRDLSDFRDSLTHSNFGSEKDFVGLRDLHQRMRSMMEQFQREAIGAIQAGDLFGSISNDPETRKMTDAARGILEKARARYQIASENLDDLLRQSAIDFGDQLQDAIADSPADVRARMLDDITKGTTSLGREVRAILEESGRSVGDLGIETMPGERANALLKSRTRAAIEARIQESEFGAFGQTMDPDEVRRAWSRRPSAQLAAANALKAAQELEPEHRANLARQLETYRSNPNSEINQVNVATAQQQLTQLWTEMDALRLASDRGLESIVDFSARGRQALEEHLGRGISELILGFGSLEDAAKSFAQDLVRIFSDIAARNLIHGLLGNLAQPSAGDPTGMRSGGGLFGGFLSNMFGGMLGGGDSFSPSAPKVQSSARGDIYPGGLKIPRMAQGGFVTEKPQFAWIGDSVGNANRASPEAVVPLARGPGGRLGILNHGGGGSSAQPVVNIVVVDNHEQAMRAAARMEMTSPGARAHILDTWASDFQNGGVTFRTARRKG